MNLSKLKVGDPVSVYESFNLIDSGTVIEVLPEHVVAQLSKGRSAFWTNNGRKSGNMSGTVTLRPDTTEPEEPAPLRRPLGAVPKRVKEWMEKNEKTWEDAVDPVTRKWKEEL